MRDQESTRERTIRFCAEIAWNSAFAWAFEHGQNHQQAADAADSVRSVVLGLLDEDVSDGLPARRGEAYPAKGG